MKSRSRMLFHSKNTLTESFLKGPKKQVTKFLKSLVRLASTFHPHTHTPKGAIN